jgi:hypothetical protein
MSFITWNMRSPLQLQPARFLSAQLLRINDGGTGCSCFCQLRLVLPLMRRADPGSMRSAQVGVQGQDQLMLGDTRRITL